MALESRLSKTWFSRYESPTTHGKGHESRSCVPTTRMPFSWACSISGATAWLIASQMLKTACSNSSLPEVILAMSSTSFTTLSKWRPECWMMPK